MAEARYILPAEDLDLLFRALHLEGYQTVGPAVRDDAIVYDIITSADELPAGWVDEQEAGKYVLRHTGSKRVFDFTVGPHAWRRFLRPPRERLWTSSRDDDGGVSFVPEPPPAQRYALIGVRSCDIAALGVLDEVLTGQEHQDERYARRREGAFVVAVQCARAGGTCFCTSMNTGPRSERGFDLALTELSDNEHVFFVEVGSTRGAEIATSLALEPADSTLHEQAMDVTAKTAGSMGRTLDTSNLRELLRDKVDDPHWDEVASRCLACSNCTMVCPTCFCTSVETQTDLYQTTSTQTQVWDSCFHSDFSHMHGGAVRASTKSKYRQWLTHKLSTWHDQFGQSGCVGCGRCITWCPVGIDLTAEVARLRATEEQ